MQNADLNRLAHQFRAAVRRTLLSWGLARCLVVVLALLAGIIFADYSLRFSVGARATALVLFAMAAAAVIFFDVVRPLRRKWTQPEVLNHLDRLVPGSHESLINLAELSERSDAVVEARSERGREILKQAVLDLEKFVKGARLPDIFRPRALRYWQALAVSAVLLFAVFGVLAPGVLATGLARLFLPFASIRWPQKTYLTITQPTQKVTIAPTGAPYTVKARIQGETPKEVLLVYTSPSTRREIREGMEIKTGPAGAECAFTFPELSDRVDFYLEGGDDRTDEFSLRVLNRPSLTKIVAAYVFPPYSRVPPKRVEGGQLAGLEGAKVTVAFTASKDLRKASIAFGGQAPQDAPLDSPRTFHMNLVLEKDATYEVRLLDVDGLNEAHPEKYSIRVTPDLPPVARLTSPPGDLSLTPNGRLRVGFSTADDFGLTEVKFMYKLGEKGEPAVLSDRITGLVAQSGKQSAGSFNWDLQKMDLKAPTFVTFYVTAKDCNPSGKGVAQSDPFRIDVLTPLEFQTRAVLAAKRAVTEARLAEQNQRWSAIDSAAWLAGKEKAPEKAAALLEQTLAEQEAAGRAVRALDRLFESLRAEVDANRMQHEFFDRRMAQISEALRKAVDVRLPGLEKAIEGAKPKSAEEEQPEARVKKMRTALTAIQKEQKLAAVAFREILTRLLDWNDLQGVLVQTQHLEKEQGEIVGAAERETKPFIGKEIQDLTDEQARQLERIAQRQKALGEAESALEEELQKLISTASVEGRRKVFDPLFHTFKGLKDNLISNRMRRSGEAIADNRTHEVLSDLALVSKALRFINDGLQNAGLDVPPLMADAEALKIALADERGKPVETAVAVAPTQQIDIELKPGEVAIPDEARVETVERYLQDLGDAMQALLDRTGYYQKRTKNPMPGRYQRLQLGWLGRRHALSHEAAAKAEALAAKSDFKELPGRLTALKGEVADVMRLLEAKKVGRNTQELQEDVVATTKDLRRFLHDRKQQLERQADRVEKKGKDDFGRDYVLAGQDMGAAVTMMENLAWAHVLEADAGRKARHLLSRPEDAPPPDALDKEIAARELAVAEARQAEVVRRIEEMLKLQATLSAPQAKEEMAARIAPNLSAEPHRAVLQALKARKVEPALAEKLKLAEAPLRQSLVALADLAEERVKAEVAAAEPPPPEVGTSDIIANPEKMTPEKLAELRARFLKDRQPEELRKKILANQSLPPAVRERLLATLQGQFDPRYELLQSAYFLELLQEGK